MGLAAASFAAASLAAFWPGVAMYDTVAQYAQAVSGRYDDWHPPVMARLWSVLAPLGPGAAPMLVMQLLGYWLGLGLLAAALAERGRRGAGCALLAVGLLPPFLGWQGVVLKDAQLVGALLAMVGAIGWWRLRERRIPGAGLAAIAVLAGYAILVRANAVFAVVPLLVTLSPYPRRAVGKLAVGAATILAVLALAPVVNHRLLRAAASGVERTQALYDLAGIAIRAAPGAATGLTIGERDEIAARHCASPFFWDPLGDDTACGATMARMRRLPVATLYATLASAAIHHPLAYLEARLAHLNSTERWLVPLAWPEAAPPAASEPNALGLGAPGAAASAWQTMAAAAVETPLGWPVAWVAVALTALGAASVRRSDAAGRLATALLVSALTLEASFAVLSIASDLRYHLWPMIATALAVVLLADRRPPLRRLATGGLALLIVVVGGTAARVLRARPPQTYSGMLHWAPNAAIRRS